MELLQQVGAICLVLGLVWIAARTLGRRQGGGMFRMALFRNNLFRGELIRCLSGRKVAPNLSAGEKVRLTPQHSIHMVTAGSKTWLVGCYSGGMSVLGEMPEQVADATMAGKMHSHAA
jgi:hypothetical protein